ncbi:YolD-like family protein [Geomicrobium sp. JCM 19038]|uniref:YolD-like family protein n=1 Tax=Geomicrobium sp. JCM 19038 TaxID=1460635 RepID=UPI00045F33D4|nr:YolD-like family protein [Geomicrobium sp. JCM 19038]GAK09438.1 hypothetical protein JCM19038_3272 [Geomicrobium sp. JCM 19038]
MNKLTPGGNMRWESMRMILPEHREAWLTHQEENKKVQQPVLDEQHWQEFEYILSEAMEYHQLLTFIFWHDGHFYEIIGHCHFINNTQKQFHILTVDEEIHYLKFDVLINLALH